MLLAIRVFRRAGVEMEYSKGYHPKPLLQFAPALGLGIASLGELCDARVIFDGSAAELEARLRAAAPEGLVIEAVRRMDEGELPLSKVLALADCAAWVPGVVEAQALRSGELVVERMQKGVRKRIEVSKHLVSAQPAHGEDRDSLLGQLEWPAGGTVLRFRLRIGDDGGAKPSEVVQALLGAAPPDGTRYARLALWGGVDEQPVDAFLAAMRSASSPDASVPSDCSDPAPTPSSSPPVA
jgi:radical SAM-linked protein